MPSTLSKALGVRVPHAQLQKLEALAAQRGTTRSAVATEALCHGISLLEQQHGEPPRASPEPFELSAFATLVLEAARRSPTGRFGADRILVNHVWKHFDKLHPDSGLGEDSFKDKLLEANRERLLSLGCADMAPLLDQADVQASEIRYRSATFHLLCI